MTIADNPGRTCPLDYRYEIASFSRNADFEADALYVAGGLYGNTCALGALEELALEEGAALVFNGDFHWFDRDPVIFAEVNHRVLRHHVLRGNVETELGRSLDVGAGCGCAYPSNVDRQTVAWSNAIFDRLRRAACVHEAQRVALASLPMNLVAKVGGLRIGIVHGDCESLAGWRFSNASLDLPHAGQWLQQVRLLSNIDVFTSTHTCLPVMRGFDFASGPLVVANNGAAGMPNFKETTYGIVTRISTRPWHGHVLHRIELDGVSIEAIALSFDVARWHREFLSQWPPGSEAWRAYWLRITSGPAYSMARAYFTA